MTYTVFLNLTIDVSKFEFHPICAFIAKVDTDLPDGAIVVGRFNFKSDAKLEVEKINKEISIFNNK